MSEDTLMQDEEGAVDPKLPPDPSRRFWVTTACAVGGVAGVATAVPFVSTFAPSAKARAAGAPVEVDIADLAPGQMRTVEWRGKPVWIMRRTDEQLKAIKSQDPLVADPESNRPGFTPAYAKNEYRSRKPDLLVCVGICTHLGCSPTPHFETGSAAGMPANWQGGFLCPCHGSTFDLAGRVYKNKPAPDNLEVPPYQYLSEGRIIVGVDEDNKA
ncbi:ubiquinol-cytochrome c reductase iron-sulfur subunit [Bordetella genomosp. 12]|uniref:Ubiquinol-cytochrome c reductase iron-sulfur subunit n=1 Tax=Bordetella genomosp. 12 TaxID=463035 RepID=A0A261VV16_9BORD|nr:ubiquinol-cytochrome c reductase iron-sulfur subunit [Bordetella genomosp. 12]OZI77133.1 ubiquinol-cytochrome c reductase iron-sulfur subunit [Bordetella genomosp. 12]